MLTSLKVTGFRNLSSLSMEGLTRVNLLVGENNAGKTSVLEAIEILLLARSEPLVLTNGSLRRGENVPPQFEEELDSGATLDLGYLFPNRNALRGIRFDIEGDISGNTHLVSCSVEAAEIRPARAGQLRAGQPLARTLLDISVEFEPGLQTFRLPLEFRVDSYGRRLSQLADDAQQLMFEIFLNPSVLFVGTEAPHASSLGALWDGIVLTPEETKVVEALQIIQPDIDRLAWLSHSGRSSGGMFVKLQHSDRRFPLGSMGDGIKRLLVLAMNLVKSAGGYLLVDEIDTGLHYSVMVKMWRLVVETARRLNIQVFATSHSLDCIQALAGLYEDEPDVRDEISLHRIEKGAEASIRYSADEILAAARRQVEVR
jgi:ABC-type branched-subunit amino acid transport system ATPase component